MAKMSLTVAVLLAVAGTIHAAEIREPRVDNEIFKPDLRTAPVENLLKNNDKQDLHPVFHEPRANIAPVTPTRPAVRHSNMLADQPMQGQEEMARMDTMSMPNYVAVPTDVYSETYAPAYPHDNRYDERNGYENYNTGLSNYMLDPDASIFSLMWQQMPNARALVGFMGRTIAWALNGFFALALGSLLTMGLCTYTNLCTLTFHGIGSVEEMRSLVTPEKLHKISNAADFVKRAINKYESIQETRNH